MTLRTASQVINDLIEINEALSRLKSQHEDCQQELISIVGLKDEGSYTAAIDGYKITTSQPVRRSFSDTKLARDLAQKLPRDVADGLIDWRPHLSVKVYKDLQKYQPDTFKEVTRAVTEKPGKPTVKFEAIPDESA